LSDREQFVINCSLCNEKHFVEVGVEYEYNPFAAGFNDRKVPIKFNYICPKKSIPSQVTFYFTTGEAKKFINAHIISVRCEQDG